MNITVSPAAFDGTFVWVAVDARPPEGYAPVVFAPPDGTPALQVCREDPGAAARRVNTDAGFVVLSPATSQLLCQVGGSGRSRPTPQYEQLWAQADAVYRWDRVAAADLPLATSRFVRSNRAVTHPAYDLERGTTSFLWQPCADQYEGRWYLGKTSMGASSLYGCEFALNDRTEMTSGTALLLYAPIK